MTRRTGRDSLNVDRIERGSALMFSNEWHRAVGLGHDLELGWHDTELGSWVAQCLMCEQWLGLDYNGQEGRDVYGIVAEGVCSGPPPALTPYTRSPFDEEAADQPARPKRMRGDDVGPVIEFWNWA
jgi:hypothetical protein